MPAAISIFSTLPVKLPPKSRRSARDRPEDRPRGSGGPVSTASTVRVRSVAFGLAIGLAVGIGLVAVAPAGASARDKRDSTTVRLGYFDNVTHAPALVGLEEGFFENALGSQDELETSIFKAGPEAVDRASVRLARRDVHRAEPDRVGVRAVPRRSAGRLGCRVRRRVPRREAGDQEREGPEGQDDRVSAARQHPGRRAAQLSEEQGSRDRHGRRR